MERKRDGGGASDMPSFRRVPRTGICSDGLVIETIFLCTWFESFGVEGVGVEGEYFIRLVGGWGG